MKPLQGKIALVTGASRGIGKTVAESLAREGADVIVTYRKNEEMALQVVKAISASGHKARSIELDVTSSASVRSLAADIENHEGRLDILVNNAGVNKPEDFDKITEEDWDYVLAVNLKGPFSCTQALLPLLRKSGHASVINIGSVSGQYGGPRTAHYAASKAGLISLSQVMARYGANNGFRSNTIAVGMIGNDMGAKGMNSPIVSRAMKNILLNRFGTAEDVAHAVIFLASDASAYITAQTINVNGGLYF